jgi:hypothetical protein
LRLGFGGFFGTHPREGEEEGKEKGKREKEKRGEFAGFVASFGHRYGIEQGIEAMRLNSYPQLTRLIRELIFLGNSTRVWWRVSEEEGFQERIIMVPQAIAQFPDRGMTYHAPTITLPCINTRLLAALIRL